MLKTHNETLGYNYNKNIVEIGMEFFFWTFLMKIYIWYMVVLL